MIQMSVFEWASGLKCFHIVAMSDADVYCHSQLHAILHTRISYRFSYMNPPPQHPPTGAHESLATDASRAVMMFAEPKEYVYQAMEEDAYPRFLRSHFFGNLLPVSAGARLGVGILFLLIALAVGFVLIFLDVEPKSIRFVVSLNSPFLWCVSPV